MAQLPGNPKYLASEDLPASEWSRDQTDPGVTGPHSAARTSDAVPATTSMKRNASQPVTSLSPSLNCIRRSFRYDRCTVAERPTLREGRPREVERPIRRRDRDTSGRPPGSRRADLPRPRAIISFQSTGSSPHAGRGQRRADGRASFRRRIRLGSAGPPRQAERSRTDGDADAQAADRQLQQDHEADRFEEPSRGPDEIRQHGQGAAGDDPLIDGPDPRVDQGPHPGGTKKSIGASARRSRLPPNSSRAGWPRVRC